MKLYEVTTPSITMSREDWLDYVQKTERGKDRRALGLAKYITKYCQPWLSQTNKGAMIVYRGFSYLGNIEGYRLSGQHAPLYFTRAVRQDRQPRNTNKKMHDKINTALADCGAVANRTNSVFVTGSHQQASYYGTVYVVIPVGQFKYTWSPYYTDWYEYDWQIDAAIDSGSFCDKISWDNNSLPEAIDRWGEIMVACQKYIAIRTDFYPNVQEHL